MEGKKLPGVHFPAHAPAQALCWAPFARSLQILTAGNERFALKPKTGGWWQGECPGLKPGARYSFQINEKERFADPAALSQPDGVHGASEAVDLNLIRSFKVEGWQGIPQKELIIYELHVGTFSSSGNFEGVVEKLSYLQALGVNAIELMPVASFPGDRNWGYDGVFPYAVQHSYGGARGLAALVKACHTAGLAVILDVVYNHVGPEGNILGAYGPFFTRRYTTPWGKAINFDGRGSRGVRNFFIENALMWLRDFDLDGLRLDAIHAIADHGPKHFLLELSEAVKQLNASSGRNHLLIAESDLNDPAILKPGERGGLGLDAQWNDDWHHALHALLTNERNGYYKDFGALSQLEKAFQDAFVFDGKYSSFRQNVHGHSARDYPGQKFIVFTQNHDQVGNRALGERLSSLTDYEGLKLAAGALLFSPFIPMLFMGEEYGEDNPFLFFTSHGNEQLARRVREGRKRECRAFRRGGDLPDPQAEDTFLKSRLKWDQSLDPRKGALLSFYMHCIHIRKKKPALFSGDRSQLKVKASDEDNVLRMYRKLEGGMLLMVFNFAALPLIRHEPNLSGKRVQLWLYSAHQKWGGGEADEINPVETQEKKVFLKQKGRSLMVLFLHD